MVSRTSLLAAAAVAFAVGVAAGGAATAVAVSTDSPFASQPDAALQEFDTVSVGCVDPAAEGAVDRTVSAPNGSGADLTLRENVTVDDPNVALDARFDRIAPGTYRLAVRTEQPANRTACDAGRPEARFAANLTLPSDYTLLLTVDGEYVGVNYASAGATSGSAGAGRSVSGGAKNES
ncbi:hypothetical protein [Halobaculum sp. D14]|uniref:hypothetical protein n=1 Tax=Halobaculum sp. D14 TaxID=3421642 RepID=UPI003EBB21B0